VGLAALWVAIVTAGEMTVTDQFGLRTYAEELYTQLAARSTDPIAGVLSLWPALLLVLALSAAGLAICAAVAPRDRPIPVRPAAPFRLGRSKLPVALAVLAALVLVVGVPLGNLVYQAGAVAKVTELASGRRWSLAKAIVLTVQSPWNNRWELGASLAIGAVAATAATALAVALGTLARRRRMSWLALAPAAVCLAVPGPVLALAVIRVLDSPGHAWLAALYDRSILAPCLVMGLRALPPAILLAWHAARTVPQEMLDCAAVDGAGPVRRFGLAIGLLWPAWAAAWLVAMAVATGELAASILVVPPGVVTLPILIFNLIHYGVMDRVAAICLALVVLFAAAAATAGVLLRRAWQKNREL
jgi:iron(III) transport system permease protein